MEKKKSETYLTDEEYISNLEGLVCFLANCYERARNTYFDKHLEACSIANPNRRELTDQEKSEWLRFPLIQGSSAQNIVSKIAKSGKPKPKNIEGLIKRFEKI